MTASCAPYEQVSGAGSQQRRHDRQQRGLAGAVGPKQPQHLAGAAGKSDLAERSTTSEVPADARHSHFVEIDVHAAQPLATAGRHAAAVERAVDAFEVGQQPALRRSS